MRNKSREIENHIDKDLFLDIARKISNKKSLQYFSQDFKYGDRFDFFDDDAQCTNSYTINVTPELEKLLKDVNFEANLQGAIKFMQVNGTVVA